HGKNEFLVTFDDPPKELSLLLYRPERVWIFKCAAAEHPTFDEVGMHVARFLDREVALIHRAEALGAEAHLFVQCEAREDFVDPPLRLGIKTRIDVVTDQDGEADFVQRIAQLRGNGALIRVSSMEESTDVHRPNLELVIELIAVQSLGELVVLALLDLVVADEILVRGPDSVFFRLHAW